MLSGALIVIVSFYFYVFSLLFTIITQWRFIIGDYFYTVHLISIEYVVLININRNLI